MLDPAHLDEYSDIPDAHQPPSESRPDHRSTGPRTPQGKARSCQNSVTHGCRSNILILHGEKQEDFDDLYDRWKEAYQPDTSAALELLEQLVLEKWFLLRTERRYSEVEEQLSYFPFTKWNDGQHKIYQLALRYKTAAARSASKAQRDLEDFLKNRRAEDKFRQQLNEQARATYFEAQEGIQHREQHLQDSIKEAESRGLDVSSHKAELAEVKKQNRATLARMREGVTGLETVKSRAQLLFQGQNSPKKLRKINILDQWVEITIQDGATLTSLTPSNQKLIEKGQTMDPPPELVYRRLNFLHGVPGEYDWTDPDPLLRKYGGFGTQRMSIDTWLDVIVAEKLRTDGHIGPCGSPLTRPKERGGCDCPHCTRIRERLEEGASSDPEDDPDDHPDTQSEEHPEQPDPEPESDTEPRA